MMKSIARVSFLVLAVAAALSPFSLTTVALATIDPGIDSMGMYFDTGADVRCTAAGMFSLVSAYLVLANPAGPIDGYACRLDLVGAPYMLSGQSGPGADADAATLGYLVSGFSAPFTGGNLVLRTFTLMLTGPGELDFLIGAPNSPILPPNDLPLVHRNGAWLRCGVSSGNVLVPVAVLNGACPVPGEVESFGAVKALFR